MNRLMSEQLLPNDRRAGKTFDHAGFEPLTSRSLTKSTAHSAIMPFLLLCCNQRFISNKLYFGVRAIEITKMKNESVKKSVEKSKNVLEEKRKNAQATNLHRKIPKRLK